MERFIEQVYEQYLMKGFDVVGIGEKNAEVLDRVAEKLYEYEQAEEEGKLLKLPVSIGDTVYVFCECEMIPRKLDGTLYSSNGYYGTATGYYCPYEDSCPHESDECVDFDCDRFQQKSAVFEDTVSLIMVKEDAVFISTENCNICGMVGVSVFLTREEAEAKRKEMEEKA